MEFPDYGPTGRFPLEKSKRPGFQSCSSSLRKDEQG